MSSKMTQQCLEKKKLYVEHVTCSVQYIYRVQLCISKPQPQSYTHREHHQTAYIQYTYIAFGAILCKNEIKKKGRVGSCACVWGFGWMVILIKTRISKHFVASVRELRDQVRGAQRDGERRRPYNYCYICIFNYN